MTGPPFDPPGRAALVAGGEQGPGRAKSRGRARAGADVVIASRHEAGRRAADLSRRCEAERPAREAEAAFGRVDLLVNIAGTNDPQPVEPLRDEDRDRLAEPNLTARMAPPRAPGLRHAPARLAWVIHVGSALGLVADAGRAACSATGAAPTGLVRAGAIGPGPAW